MQIDNDLDQFRRSERKKTIRVAAIALLTLAAYTGLALTAMPHFRWSWPLWLAGAFYVSILLLRAAK